MDTGQYTIGLLGHINRTLTGAVDGLTPEELAYQPDKESNSIGFILWHQVKVEDSMINGMIQGKPQLWESENWCEKLGFESGFNEDGWGYSAEQVSSFKIPELKVMMEYARAVRNNSEEYLNNMSPEELEEIKKAPFGEMPVSGILSMLVCELALHTGQIAYIRGLQRGINK